MLSVQPSSPGQKSGWGGVLLGWLLQPNLKVPLIISHRSCSLESLNSAQYMPSVCYLKVRLIFVHHPTIRTQRMTGLSPVLNSYIQTLLKSVGNASLTKQTCPLSSSGADLMRRYRDDGCMGWRMWSCPHSSLSKWRKGPVNSNKIRNMSLYPEQRQGRVSLGGQGHISDVEDFERLVVGKLDLRFQTLPSALTPFVW